MEPHPALVAVQALLLNALAGAAADEIDMPHLVVCHDPFTGRTTYSGPYSNMPAALVGASAEEADMNSALPPGEPRWTFSVAALYPPHPASPDAPSRRPD